MDQIQVQKKNYPLVQPWAFMATLLVIAAVTALAPAEQTLGANLKIIILHGAWVWTGKIAFGLASLAGLAALMSRKAAWHSWSLALGRTGMTFWLTYLPMSLVVMQMNWGGFFFDEPRWRVPFTFAVVGVLLQIAYLFLNQPIVSSVGNLLFGVGLWWSLGEITNVLHPDAPIAQSNSLRIQIFYVILLGLGLLAGAQITLWWRKRAQESRAA